MRVYPVWWTHADFTLIIFLRCNLIRTLKISQSFSVEIFSLQVVFLLSITEGSRTLRKLILFTNLLKTNRYVNWVMLSLVWIVKVGLVVMFFRLSLFNLCKVTLIVNDVNSYRKI